MNTGKGVTIELAADDLLAINNALNEVCHGPDAIPDPEFQTRMGVDRGMAEQTLGRIRAALDKVSSSPAIDRRPLRS